MGTTFSKGDSEHLPRDAIPDGLDTESCGVCVAAPERKRLRVIARLETNDGGWQEDPSASITFLGSPEDGRLIRVCVGDVSVLVFSGGEVAVLDGGEV